MTEVWQLYEEAAASYDRDRRELCGEEFYLREAIARLKKRRPQVLDLGCGTGAPIARFLIESGCEVTGIDAAPAMIALARARFREMAWLVCVMRELSLARRFDAIIAWDSFFHLRPDDQRAMSPVFRDHAGESASLPLTSGPDAGEAMGSLYGRDLYHASLSAAEYRELFHRHGFDVLLHRVRDAECGGPHCVACRQALIHPAQRVAEGICLIRRRRDMSARLRRRPWGGVSLSEIGRCDADRTACELPAF